MIGDVEALDKPLPVELELMAEKASALALAAGKLEAALAALAAADQPAAPEATRKRRSELRSEAARRLWYLIVQREAIGLRSHEDVFRLYRIPAEVRVYSGR
jgi:hypothetical protein